MTRVEQSARRHDVPVARVLASAMAHEIAHLLQRHEHHAAQGVMRAQWTREDFKRAATGTLQFAPSDATTFRAGIR